MGITLKLQLHSPTLQANMKSLLVVSVLVGALASVKAIKVGSETKVDSKSQWPYGSGYGMMGHGMMEDCMMCDSYYGCPSWCYSGWNYPYQALSSVDDKSDAKWWYGNGYGMMGHDMMDDCMMCDMYHGCPSWCY